MHKFPHAPSSLFRAFSTYPKRPFRKQLIIDRKQRPVRQWLSLNDPKLQEKYLRYANRIGNEYGVIEDVKKFDQESIAFKNSPPIEICAIIERPNVVMRDVEDWEGNFLDYKFNIKQNEAKQYPKQLLDMFNASNTVLESTSSTSSENEKSTTHSSNSSSSKTPSSSQKSPTPSSSLSDFYDDSTTITATSSLVQFEQAARITPADNVSDLRSLDRAYTQRLVLLVKDKKTQEWTFPHAPRLATEPMKQGLERIVRSYIPDPNFDAWFVSNSPIGHFLHVYSPKEQAEKDCYGMKMFFYRVEIIGGKFKVLSSNSSFPYDDFVWVTRDESEKFLSRKLYKYAHQIIGAGPGEEYERRLKWLNKIQEKNLTIAQATGRRNHRVSTMKNSNLRLPLISTRTQIEIASLPFGEKEGLIKKEMNQYAYRVGKQVGLSKKLQEKLSKPPAAVLFAQRSKTSKSAIGN
jgi:hypothetical protein